MKLYEYELTFHGPNHKVEVNLYAENYTKAYWGFIRIENEHNIPRGRFEFYGKPKRTGKVYYDFPFEKALRYFKAWRLKRARLKKVARG